MTTIPDDIRKQAAALWITLSNQRADRTRIDPESAIAEALMREREAQRERDEKIAELAADDESDRQWNAATRYIMRRIRSQTL